MCGDKARIARIGGSIARNKYPATGVERAVGCRIATGPGTSRTACTPYDAISTTPMTRPRRPISACALLLALVPLAGLADADATAASGTRVAPEPFETHIELIERDGGALDQRLAEHFLGLGLAHRENGDLDDALDAFERALHVNRINKGLHHLVHVPIIDLLIETAAAKGDWHTVDRHQRLRYWIHRRERDGHSDEYIDATLAFASWQTRAHHLDTGVPSFRKLRGAQKALDAAHAAVTRDGRSDHPRLIEILNAQAQAYLNLALYVSQTHEDIATGGLRAGDDFGDILERRNLIIESYIRGKHALERVVQLTETPAQRVENGLAWANLADWELAFERTQSSADHYRRAYASLVDAGLSPDDLEREFGRPRQLAGFSVRRRSSVKPPTETKNAHVTASFTVTKSGKVRDINVVSAAPADNTRIVRRTRETLRQTRFRPSIGSDGPVEASTTIRYVFPDVSI